MEQKKLKRESLMLFIDMGTSSTPEWLIIGKDNEDISRTLNNEVTSTKNVLGESDTTITKGSQTTTVDPYKIRTNEKISTFLQDLYISNADSSDLEVRFMEVFVDEAATGTEYKAFTQTGAIDIKSWGGDTTGISAPFDINWLGPRTHGMFDVATKTFTPTVA